MKKIPTSTWFFLAGFFCLILTFYSGWYMLKNSNSEVQINEYKKKTKELSEPKVNPIKFIDPDKKAVKLLDDTLKKEKDSFSEDLSKIKDNTITDIK